MELASNRSIRRCTMSLIVIANQLLPRRGRDLLAEESVNVDRTGNVLWPRHSDRHSHLFVVTGAMVLMDSMCFASGTERLTSMLRNSQMSAVFQ